MSSLDFGSDSDSGSGEIPSSVAADGSGDQQTLSDSVATSCDVVSSGGGQYFPVTEPSVSVSLGEDEHNESKYEGDGIQTVESGEQCPNVESLSAVKQEVPQPPITDAGIVSQTSQQSATSDVRCTLSASSGCTAGAIADTLKVDTDMMSLSLKDDTNTPSLSQVEDAALDPTLSVSVAANAASAPVVIASSHVTDAAVSSDETLDKLPASCASNDTEHAKVLGVSTEEGQGVVREMSLDSVDGCVELTEHSDSAECQVNDAVEDSFVTTTSSQQNETLTKCPINATVEDSFVAATSSFQDETLAKCPVNGTAEANCVKADVSGPSYAVTRQTEEMHERQLVSSDQDQAGFSETVIATSPHDQTSCVAAKTIAADTCGLRMHQITQTSDSHNTDISVLSPPSDTLLSHPANTDLANSLPNNISGSQTREVCCTSRSAVESSSKTGDQQCIVFDLSRAESPAKEVSSGAAVDRVVVNTCTGTDTKDLSSTITVEHSASADVVSQCLPISAANLSLNAPGRHDDSTHRQDDHSEPLTISSSSNLQVPLSAVVITAGRNVIESDVDTVSDNIVSLAVTDVSSDSKDFITTSLANSVSSVAQSSQMTAAIDIQLDTTNADDTRLVRKMAPTDVELMLCSRPSYVSGVDVGISSYCAQPLKSLADLVQKVSTSDHASKRTFSGADVTAVRNTPLYSGRVSYMTGHNGPTEGFGGNTDLKHSRELDGAEFKKPTRPCGPTERTPKTSEYCEDLTTTALNLATAKVKPVDGYETDKVAELKDDGMVLPVVKNPVHTSDSGKLVEGTCDQKVEKSGRRGKGRGARKCKVDAVDVNFLKDLIVACGSDRADTAIKTSQVEESLTKSSPTCDKSSDNTSTYPEQTPTLTLPDAAQSKSVAKEPKQKKNTSALQQKTTRLLNDITLIDVAAVNSCVEKDYSDFIKSIQQRPSENNTAMSEELKGRKKKAKKTTGGSPENLTAVADEQIGSGSKSRRTRNNNKSSSVVSVEGRSKGGRSKGKQKQQPITSGVRSEKSEEEYANTITKSPSDNNSCITDVLVNCTLPASRKKPQRRKKKTNLAESETESSKVTNGTVTPTDCAAAVAETSEKLAACGDRSTGDELTESSTERLSSDARVCVSPAVEIGQTKKVRSSKKKKSVPLGTTADDSDIHSDHGDGHSIAECSTTVGAKSQKRKAPAMLSELPIKAVRTVHTVLEPVECFSDPCLSTTAPEDLPIETTPTITDETVVVPDLGLKRKGKGKSSKKKRGLELGTTGAGGLSHEERIVMDSDSEPATSVGVNQLATAAIGGQNSELAQSLTALDHRMTLPSHADDLATANCKGAQDQTEQNNAMSLSEPCQSQVERDRVVVEQLAATVEDTDTALQHTEGLATEAGDARDEDGEKLFACSECSYKARKKGQLRKHLSVHKVYGCAHCGFTADSQGGLDDHMLVSHPSRCGRRLCKRCHMLFRAGVAFTDHVQQCTGQKLSWHCPSCAKEFKFISAMRTHVRRWHGDGSGDGQGTEFVTETSNVSDGASLNTDVADATTTTTTDIEHVIQAPTGNIAYGIALAPEVINSASTDTPDNNSLTTLEVTSATIPTVQPDTKLLADRHLSQRPEVSVGSDVVMNSSISSLQQRQVPSPLLDHAALQTPAAEVVDMRTTSKRLSSSAVIVDGEVRHPCDQCSKSFKARRSMVHHRRMVHEGGRLRSKQTTTTTATTTTTTTTGRAGVEVIRPDDMNAAEAGRMIIESESLPQLTSSCEVPLDIDKPPSSPLPTTTTTTTTPGATTTTIPTIATATATTDASTGGRAASVSIRQIYTCSFADCSHTFKRPGQLHRHEEKHAGPESRKFSCDWPDCRKSFLHADNLAFHRRQHTEPKPFRCDLCALAYWQKSSLRSHRLKAHGGAQTKPQVGPTASGTASDDVVPSERLITDSTNAGRIVDVIIRSVTASMQAAGSDVSKVLGPPRVIGVQELGHRELDQSTAEESSEGAVDHSSGDMPERTATAIVSKHMNIHESEPLNIYEFCEDDTSLSIRRPKPSVPLPRTSIESPNNTIEINKTSAPLWTSIESPQNTIEISNHNDDDDDVTAFNDDDDTSPSLDRLAETVITYSRRKKAPSDHVAQPAKFTEPLSPGMRPVTGRKPTKRKSSVAAGRKRKRSVVVAAPEPEVFEEPVKKARRKRRDLESATKELSKVRKSPGTRSEIESATKELSTVRKFSPGTRTTRSSQKEKTLPSAKSMQWSLVGADVAEDFVSKDKRRRSAVEATYSNRRRRKGEVVSPSIEKSVAVSTEGVEPVETVVVVDDLADSGSSGVNLVDSGKSVGRKTTRKQRRNVGSGRATRTTRQTSRRGGVNRSEENRDGPEESQTATLELVDISGNAASKDDYNEGNAEVMSGNGLRGSSDELAAGGHGLAECSVSDNTEILSLNDDNISDDNLDGGYTTHRSSPASYKSDEEREPVVMPTCCHDDNDNSLGSLLDDAAQDDRRPSEERDINSLSAPVPTVTDGLALLSSAYMNTTTTNTAANTATTTTERVTELTGSEREVAVNTLPERSSATAVLQTFSEDDVSSVADFHQTDLGLATSQTTAATNDVMRSFYHQDVVQPTTSPQDLARDTHAGLTPTSSVARAFPYTADRLAGTYPLLPVRSDGPLQPRARPTAPPDTSYLGMVTMSSSYGDVPLPSASYSMALPPYPTPDVDQSKLVGRIPSYLPYAAARNPPPTIESSTIYGRSMPPPAFPSEAFTKDFFGQYLHEATPPGPLHPLATHGPLHDQAAAGLLGSYQQSATLPTMPHPPTGPELFRRAYSGVSDNIFGGMKSPPQATGQPQHWMTPAGGDASRRWNQTPPSGHSDVPRYNYPPGRPDDAAKSLPTKHPDDISSMFGAATTTSVHYPSLPGSVYSSPGPPPYPHPSLPPTVNPSQRQLEDAYRQMAAAGAGDYRSLAAAGDYRSLAQHRTPSEMYGSALSSLDRYYYTARDAMYRAAAIPPHPFIPQTTIATPQYPDRGGYGRPEPLPTYGQSTTPGYGFMCPPTVTEKQSMSSGMRPGVDYLDNSGPSQEAYSRHHSVIYNMMPRYF